MPDDVLPEPVLDPLDPVLEVPLEPLLASPLEPLDAPELVEVDVLLAGLPVPLEPLLASPLEPLLAPPLELLLPVPLEPLEAPELVEVEAPELVEVEEPELVEVDVEELVEVDVEVEEPELVEVEVEEPELVDVELPLELEQSHGHWPPPPPFAPPVAPFVPEPLVLPLETPEAPPLPPPAPLAPLVLLLLAAPAISAAFDSPPTGSDAESEEPRIRPLSGKPSSALKSMASSCSGRMMPRSINMLPGTGRPKRSTFVKYVSDTFAMKNSSGTQPPPTTSELGTVLSGIASCASALKPGRKNASVPGSGLKIAFGV